MSKKNRTYKDTVFTHIFSHDRDAKKNFLSLYNAIHGTQLKYEEVTIENKEISQTLYHSYNNDVSMMIDGKLIVLCEHQSTINENMPLRFLDYITRLYEDIIPMEKRYKHIAIKIPAPEFYVFYTGKQNYPETKQLHLSDSFLKTDDSLNLELNVTVFNINSPQHENLNKLEQCDILVQYCRFVETVRQMKKDNTVQCYNEAIHYCIKNGILAEYLKRNSKEVTNMLIAEYDYDLDIKVQREEAFEQGELQGKELGIAEGKELGITEGKLETARLMLRENIAVQTIAKCTGLDVEVIEKLGDN